jgi:imidazoleglycerol phosphate dehydratase HisB
VPGLRPGAHRDGKPFLDHMLATFGRYAGLSLGVRARGT